MVKKRIDINLKTVNGIIVPADWNENGNIVAVAISTNNEDTYFTEKDEKGEESLRFFREEVEINGILRKQENIQAIIMNLC